MAILSGDIERYVRIIATQRLTIVQQRWLGMLFTPEVIRRILAVFHRAGTPLGMSPPIQRVLDNFIDRLAEVPEQSLPNPHFSQPQALRALFALLFPQSSPRANPTVSTAAVRMFGLDQESTGFMYRMARSLQSGDVERRNSAVSTLRSTDRKYNRNQGLIFLPLLRSARDGIRRLVEQLGPSVAIFSLERGGSLLADTLARVARKRDLQVFNIPKYPAEYEEREVVLHGQPEPLPYQKEEHGARLVKAILDYADAFFRSHAQREEVTIAITETVVGGGSGSFIMGQVSELLRRNPKLRFRVLLERQTIHGENPLGSPLEIVNVDPFGGRVDVMLFEKGGYKLSLGGGQQAKVKRSRREKKQEQSAMSKEEREIHVRRMKEEASKRKSLASATSSSSPSPSSPSSSSNLLAPIYISQVPYIVGEDVGYQVTKRGPGAAKPIVIYNVERREVSVLCIEPTGGARARDLLVDLVAGVYDEALRLRFGEY